jgi:predicted nucleic acid-binding protein
MKILIDTNVILDALMNRAPWANAAQGVMLAVAEEKAVGCITASTFTDIYYLLRRHLQDRERTKRTLRGLLSVISVLDVNGKDCEEAFELPMQDYEDAHLAYCAKRHNIDNIITRNVKHFDGSPVKAVRPEDFLV